MCEQLCCEGLGGRCLRVFSGLKLKEEYRRADPFPESGEMECMGTCFIRACPILQLGEGYIAGGDGILYCACGAVVGTGHYAGCEYISASCQ